MKRIGLSVLCLALLGSAGCGSGRSNAGPSATPATLRLGYFANLTHAPALIGVERGFFGRQLGSGVKLQTAIFNAGPAAVEALFSDAIDVAYIGPNPAINAFARSEGKAIRIVSGAASGGASLVVKPNLTAAQLRGTTLATPQLGGTQDVALRWWLSSRGLKTTVQGGGGDLTIQPQENAQTLEAFRAGHIDGAWVPEPWATRLVEEGGGKILIDERDLWPDRKFVTTHIIVRTEYLRAHRDVVARLIDGHMEAVRFLSENSSEAEKDVNAAIATIVGKPLPAHVIAQAWTRLEFTSDPLPKTLETSANHAVAVGLLEPVDLDGIYDVSLLNGALQKAGQAEVVGL